MNCGSRKVNLTLKKMDVGDDDWPPVEAEFEWSHEPEFVIITDAGNSYTITRQTEDYCTFSVCAFVDGECADCEYYVLEELRNISGDAELTGFAESNY